MRGIDLLPIAEKFQKKGIVRMFDGWAGVNVVLKEVR